MTKSPRQRALYRQRKKFKKALEHAVSACPICRFYYAGKDVSVPEIAMDITYCHNVIVSAKESK